MGEDLSLDIHSVPIEGSDRLLLLSDGVDLVEIADLTGQFVDIDRAVETLCSHARSAGSWDDITAMMIQVEEIWETPGGLVSSWPVETSCEGR